MLPSLKPRPRFAPTRQRRSASPSPCTRTTWSVIQKTRNHLCWGRAEKPVCRRKPDISGLPTEVPTRSASRSRNSAAAEIESEFIGHCDKKIGALQRRRLCRKRGVVQYQPGSPIFRCPGLRTIEFQNDGYIQLSTQIRPAEIMQGKALVYE